eukprot:CAMPEP_0181139624 /NCGR_PEP_ID=MMETSP1071-20121207/34879_1 /TAXON_ID=35127 /ORGANISM="Thalassiosira sp., Strain NH16" /LENGTH=226 /DNA_ID=CAMNT_0023226539 /DNA_START=834 /DNA_END=1514 /DNA_ORIENTATION=+
MSNHAPSVYDKLNNIHASLRKQKEDAYRTKQLAEERLRLARHDRESMEKRGNDARAQLRQLKERATAMKEANAAVEARNKQMEKEYNFQHSELQGKKEKLSRLEDKRANEANSRHRSASAARDMQRRLREESSKNGDAAYAHLTTEEKRRKLERSMEDADGGAELLNNLPGLVGMRRTHKEKDLKDLEIKNASMRRIIAGYQNALGLASTAMQMPHQGGENHVLQQ